MNVYTAQTLSLAARFAEVRQATAALIARLAPEDCVVQPVVDVSPPKWHAAHTTWFFEQFLLSAYVADYQVFHPRYAYLFNSYYNGAGERVARLRRGQMTRPTTAEIMAYRQYVDAQMEAWLNAGPDLPAPARHILELGLQHEQQHQELMYYDIKYILGHNPLFPAYVEGQPLPVPGLAPSEEHYIAIGPGLYEIGYEGPDFHFDNEEGRHKVYLEPFALLDRLVTNGEYLQFIESGGYHDYRWWLDEAWKWVAQEQAEAPMYWHKIEGQWFHYTLRGLEPLDPAAPVAHVNYYEAQAYARWKGKRLPTEAEWEVACRLLAPEPPAAANFSERAAFGPLPREAGNLQFYGDLWEWTQSAYLPYPHYFAEDSALGEYNGKFMVNQMVLRGGSYATPRDHIRPSYRNFFHPHLQWLFAGFRLAESRS